MPNPSIGTSTPALPKGRVGTVAASSEANTGLCLSVSMDTAAPVQAAVKKYLRVQFEFVSIRMPIFRPIDAE
ncbi:MAG: hypothetical protein PVI58_20225 [Desulfobacterales bacterium]